MRISELHKNNQRHMIAVLDLGGLYLARPPKLKPQFKLILSD
jgi:hypothetical protein